MAAKLPDAVWDAIRTVWEYDPDEPSYPTAAERAGAKHGFKAPTSGAITKRVSADAKAGKPWERRGSMSGINKAAHRKADAMVDSSGGMKTPDGSADGSGSGSGGSVDGSVTSTKKEQAARSESEDLRAEVIARHRNEWKQIVALRQEALKDRINNPDTSFMRAKLAKITSEITKIQQDGERKAWGLDELGDFDPSKLTDAQIEDIMAGR